MRVRALAYSALRLADEGRLESRDWSPRATLFDPLVLVTDRVTAGPRYDHRHWKKRKIRRLLLVQMTIVKNTDWLNSVVHRSDADNAAEEFAMRFGAFGFVLTFCLVICLCIGCSSRVQQGWRAYGEGDYGTAMERLEPLAKDGDAKAQYLVGEMYYNGEGVAQDYDAAVRWYQRSANAGYAPAQNNLGLMYYEGQGVPQSHEDAAKWYQLAAEQGYAPAQSNLAVIYMFGQAEATDDAEARRWLRQAAEQGEPEAQFLLGSMYANGVDGPQDQKQAAKWFRK